VTNGEMVGGQVLLSATAAGSGTQIYDAAGQMVGNQFWGYDPDTHQTGVVLMQSIVNARGQTTATLAPNLFWNTNVQVTISQTFDADGRLLETRSYFTPA